MLFLTNRKQQGTTMHTRAKSPVRLSKETDPVKAKKIDSTNAYHKTNVNVAQGPRTGNPGARPGKRATFLADKADAEPLAKVINDAYVRRAHEYKEFEYTNGGSIHDNTNVSVKGKGRK